MGGGFLKFIEMYISSLSKERSCVGLYLTCTKIMCYIHHLSTDIFICELSY